MLRWAWRLYRREWRRQVLVLSLLSVAVAATVLGLGVVSNATNLKADPTFGTANSIISLPGSDPTLVSDIAAIRDRFGLADVVAHQEVAVPGSVSSLDLRAQDPNGPYGRVTLRLDSGRYPVGAAEVAMTPGAAQTFGLRTGMTWKVSGRNLVVVGIVENPLDLQDEFALVAPSQDLTPANVSVLVNASQSSVQSFRLPGGQGLGISSRGTGNRTAAEAAVLVLGTMGLLFVGLMAVAAFAVMAQRRQRALGMLGALGATDRHVRLVMLSTGATVGVTAATAGTLVGLAGWFAFAPTLQSVSGHRVDPLSMPWWAVAATAMLTVITAVVAAWWPARTVVRISVVAALSGRPPRPQPAHRFALLGAVLLAAGIVLLAFADRNRVGFIISGTAITAVGLLFFAPLAIRALATLTRRSTVAVRLAIRDLVRYQARSGAALGAVTLAVGIAATIAISASAAQAPTGPGNLSPDQIMLYLTPGGPGSPVPPLTASQQQAATARIAQLAAELHATTALPLFQAYDPQSPLQGDGPGPVPGGQAGYSTPTLAKVVQLPRGEDVSNMITLYVATPAVLRQYGVEPGQVDPASDILSSLPHLGGLQIFAFEPKPGSPAAGGQGPASPGGIIAHPRIQTVKQLPSYTSAPGTLITPHAMQVLGLQPLAAGWLIQTPHPLTASQIGIARHDAARAGLFIEARNTQKSLAPLRNWSTAAGILLALGVLGMTVGLIRSETANDLRTLTATGASSRTRRSLTGITAGSLALLGAWLGTAGAYAALLAWHRSDLEPLGRAPVANLLVILLGLPVVAATSGWLFAGQEPPAVSRRPLE